MVNTSRPLAEDIAKAQAAETSEGCWPWQGNIHASGYGRRNVNRVVKRAHILVYVALVGPIPDGYQLDHTCHGAAEDCRGGPTCRHRRCVNPEHLEPVTRRENWERGRSLSRQARDVRTCPSGHPYSEENTYVHRGKGGREYRRCKVCIRASNRASWHRKQLTSRSHSG
ncbi:HNH endonuclease signature motif containing protein [Actinophytocola sp.]|uniref:HNH endonuclease signature motif containing protein n=1 Tax=Actinophytocola sp. TaxID=1872138 RepID=UPI002D7F1A7D|nr:HNH endonuclease signature motif containing protein [Actinophytocola sp.]HET9144034.1 HNH endonuclease signature motif containing protein [Actinophytocola sp.]